MIISFDLYKKGFLKVIPCNHLYLAYMLILRETPSSSVCVCVYIYIYICVCVCVYISYAASCFLVLCIELSSQKETTNMYRHPLIPQKFIVADMPVANRIKLILVLTKQ